MREKVNESELILPKKIHNTFIAGDIISGEVDLDTTDKIRFISAKELNSKSNDDRTKYITDFALINNARQGYDLDENGKFIGSFWTRSSKLTYYTYSMYFNSLGVVSVNDNTVGSVPVLSLDLKSFISKFGNDIDSIIETRTTIDGTKKHFVNIGEYPKHRANNELQATLENLYNDGNLLNGISCTGRLYTTNGQREKKQRFSI